MRKPDITTLMASADRLLDKTENPLHRQILENYRRHALLEVAGDWEPILAPDMTVPDPHYRLYFAGVSANLRGREACTEFYKTLISGGMQVFWGEGEEIVVSDRGFASQAHSHQYLTGTVLRAMGEDVDASRLYIKHFDIMMFWRYDGHGRLIGEHVVDAGPAELIEVPAEDFITPAEATARLRPLIRPLPPFDPGR
jgi:hypothetical protein